MKITAIVLLALGVAAILRRQPAALRHWILASALACAAATTDPVPVGASLAGWLRADGVHHHC